MPESRDVCLPRMTLVSDQGTTHLMRSARTTKTGTHIYTTRCGITVYLFSVREVDWADIDCGRCRRTVGYA
jgi:hypothetical protein